MPREGGLVSYSESQLLLWCVFSRGQFLALRLLKECHFSAVLLYSARIRGRMTICPRFSDVSILEYAIDEKIGRECLIDYALVKEHERERMRRG